MKQPQFNLLVHVRRKSRISGKVIGITLCVYVLFLAVLSFASYIHNKQLDHTIVQLQQRVNESSAALQTYLVQQHKTLVAVLPSPSMVLDSEGFYPEFHDLSRLSIEDLWLTRFFIDRNVPIIRIEGTMRSSNKLNDLLQFLTQSPVFRDDHFIGLKVEEALLPEIPYEYQAQVAALKLPTFYRFIAQTAVLNNGKKETEGSQ